VGSKSKEEAHAGSLNTTGVCRDKFTKPRSGALGAIDAGAGLALAIILDKVGPLNAKDMNGLVWGGTRTENGKTKGRGFVMGIKLIIMGSVPISPIAQAEKMSTCKGLEKTFFSSHVGGL
jgi:hypothetical protein